jgi:hypothetical protein
MGLGDYNDGIIELGKAPYAVYKIGYHFPLLLLLPRHQVIYEIVIFAYNK